MQLKAFVSYSHHDRRLASHVKDHLEEYKIPTFLAHEDINVSQEWRDRIMIELNTSDVFIPLLSKSFKDSDWAPQEIGITIGRSNVLVIPLSIDGTNPFGFIANIQGKRIDNNANYYSLLIEPILAKFPHAVIPSLIERLSMAGNFRNAEALMLPLVSKFAEFDQTEINKFIDVSIGNNQVWNAADCKTKYIPSFLRLHRSKINKKIVKELEKLIK